LLCDVKLSFILRQHHFEFVPLAGPNGIRRQPNFAGSLGVEFGLKRALALLHTLSGCHVVAATANVKPVMGRFRELRGSHKDMVTFDAH